MLTDLCQELKNWFIHRDSDIHSGKFAITGGSLGGVDFLLDNQYFRVQGSVFNDGVHQYGVDTLVDETFTGTISAMAVPPAVVALATAIEEWQNKYGDAAASPYQSESWGGYSYSKGGGGGTGSSTTDVPTWKNVFADKLNRWRKA